MIEHPCPGCGWTHEMIDTMDACPPIPYSAWPERWSIHDGEGRGLMFCPALVDGDERCDTPIEDFDLPPYPWEEEEFKAWQARHPGEER